MGAPVDTGLENFEEVILKLPVTDRTKLAHWILASVVSESPEPELTADRKIEWPPKKVRWADSEDISGKKPWYDGIPQAKDLTKEERLKLLSEVEGSWADHPMTAEELIEDIYSARTTSTREINLDD